MTISTSKIANCILTADNYKLLLALFSRKSVKTERERSERERAANLNAFAREKVQQSSQATNWVATGVGFSELKAI